MPETEPQKSLFSVNSTIVFSLADFQPSTYMTVVEIETCPDAEDEDHTHVVVKKVWMRSDNKDDKDADWVDVTDLLTFDDQCALAEEASIRLLDNSEDNKPMVKIGNRLN